MYNNLMPYPQITVYGCSWCGDCFRTRRWLDKNEVPYTWVDIDRDREAEALVIKINRGLRSVPTIVFANGMQLVEPSNETLAQKLGFPDAR